MLSVTYRALSRAINETLAIVDAKVNGVLDSTNKIKQDVGRVDMNIVKISGQVAHTQKAQDSTCTSFHP